MTEENRQRKVFWQHGDIRLLAENRGGRWTAVAMEKCFKDGDGGDMWRDSPNWQAELLAQALIDTKVLVDTLAEFPKPVIGRLDARITDIGDNLALRIANLENNYHNLDEARADQKTKLRKLKRRVADLEDELEKENEKEVAADDDPGFGMLPLG
ncbi:MAG: hypothetical protein MUQ56_05780 [Thermoleophilia bacterium]|nr:hypothetical protein [Thermoleophilia bacterium]